MFLFCDRYRFAPIALARRICWLFC